MRKQMILCLAEKSRLFLYRLNHLPHIGVFSTGVACKIEDPTSDTTHGDVIHPCVRYIEEGFEGHYWWMVYTPLYDWNDKLENPRLCYADAPKGQAPSEWKYYCTITACPEEGYNSDPTLLFNKGKLFVFWRECQTPRVLEKKLKYATFGCTVKNKVVTYLSNPLLTNTVISEDFELCPSFLEIDGKFKAYTIHLRFDPDYIFKLPKILAKAIYKLIDYTTAFGIYSRMLCHGIAIWEGDSFDKTFKYKKTTSFNNKNWLYNPWHMDIFSIKDDKEKQIYSIIQSNEKYADICLGWSNNNENFQILIPPLVTEKSIKMKGIYKSTAQVVDGVFHMYYTAKDKTNPSIHKLFLVSEKWEYLLKRINESQK